MVNPVQTVASKVAAAYTSATKGLQNYGANIGKNLAQNSREYAQKEGTKGFNNYQTKNPFPNPLKASSYQAPK